MNKLFKEYSRLRKGIKKGGLDMQFVQISAGFIPGTRCIIATCEDMSFPIGTVWYTLETGTICAIETSYVEPWARRLGIRTKLNQAIIEAYPYLSEIVTGKALGKSSKKWMLSQGYKYSKKRKCWVLKINKKGR